MQIPATFLNDVGLAELPGAVKRSYVEAYRAELQSAVGARIAATLNDDQLAEFERLSAAVGDELLTLWLEVNVPHYRDAVTAELEALKDRVRADADGILALEELVATADKPEPAAAEPVDPEATKALSNRVVLERVHQLLTAEFGACVAPLGDEEPVVLHLPGTEYAMFLYPSSPETITIHNVVHADVDFDRPGLSTHLLTINAQMIFGNLQRVRDGVLAVEASIYWESLKQRQLRRVVLAVRQLCADTAADLRAVGAVNDG